MNKLEPKKMSIRNPKEGQRVQKIGLIGGKNLWNRSVFSLFTARKQALYMLRQICTSVCLSARPSHSDIRSKRGNTEGCGLHHRVSQCLWFSEPRMVDRDDPVQVNFECKDVDPPTETAKLYTFSLITPEL